MPTPTASRSNRYGIDPFGPIYTSPPTVRTAREAKGAIYPFMSSIVLLWIHVTIPIYSTKVPSVSFPFSVVNNCRQHTRKTVLKYRPNQTPPHLRAHERTKRQRRHAAFPSMTSLYLGTAHAPAGDAGQRVLTSAILNRHGTTTVTLQRKKIQSYMHFLKNVFQE